MHTRVIVRGKLSRDIFWRYTEDHGAKFRDSVDIDRVRNLIETDMRTRLGILAKADNEIVIKVETTEA